MYCHNVLKTTIYAVTSLAFKEMIVFLENKIRITDRWWRYMKVQLLLASSHLNEDRDR